MKRTKLTIRLHPSTVADLDLLVSKSINKRKTRSEVIRLFIHMGFLSLGNWRKKEEIDL